jgi:uncharacterized protein (TIGR00661 family)
MKEIRDIPTHLYDMVISDFEPITAWSAKRNWVYSVGLSNQAALLDGDMPKPDIISPVSKFIISHFCPVSRNYGLFYQKINGKFFYPPIRDEIKKLKPTDGTDYLVYLPFYGTEKLIKHLSAFENVEWKVFSKHATRSQAYGNVQIEPIDKGNFIAALETCKGVLCSAGFGTTSEALYLKKKLMIIPMKSQYEQQCNAYYLGLLGVPVMPALKEKHHKTIQNWLMNDTMLTLELKDENNKLVRTILEDFVKNGVSSDLA